MSARPRIRRLLRSRAAFTLVETLIASTIAVLAGVLMVQMNFMASTFAAQGFREAKMIKDSQQAMDQMVRYLNGAYGTNSSNTAYVYSIQNSNTTIEFSTPSSGATPYRERYRFDATAKKLVHERLSGSSWSQVEGSALVDHVLEFDVANQGGLINLVIRVQIVLPRWGTTYETKQYTLVGRALPRNL